MAAFQHCPSRKSICREQGRDWNRVKLTTALNVMRRSPKTSGRSLGIPRYSWKFFLHLLFNPKPKEEA